MALKMPDPRVVRILFNQRVPMRDDITLSADVYLPVGEPRQRPVILSRTPYLKADMGVVERAMEFVKRGYVYVAMDVRGRGDSDGGEFNPYFNEGRDGYDSIEWCATTARPDSVTMVGEGTPDASQMSCRLKTRSFAYSCKL